MSSTSYIDGDMVTAALAVKTENYDEFIRDCIEVASREIDAHCGRYFYEDETSSARVFFPDDQLYVRIDDASSIVSVKTDTAGDGTYVSTLATTDYLTEPLNGVMKGLTGWPTTALRSLTSSLFPVYSRRPPIQVTAVWGWAAVPMPVQQACLILAEALVKQTEAPGGIAGQSDFGVIRMPNDELNLVRAKLRPYVKYGGLGIGTFA